MYVLFSFKKNRANHDQYVHAFDKNVLIHISRTLDRRMHTSERLNIISRLDGQWNTSHGRIYAEQS